MLWHIGGIVMLAVAVQVIVPVMAVVAFLWVTDVWAGNGAAGSRRRSTR